MPYYDYNCLECNDKFSTFIAYEDYETMIVKCPRCNSKNIQRQINRVRVARSEENRLENLADPSALDGIENDPRAMGRMMRQMSSELGEEMGPEFNEGVSRLEAGQDPTEIEKDLPDLDKNSSFGVGGSEGNPLCEL